MSDQTTTTTPTLLDKSGETSGELFFSTFGKATVNDNSRVVIPDDRAADFARALTYFSARSNRYTLTTPPFATEAEAKLFAKQLRQWAEDHKLSCSPTRNTDGDGRSVTWRFAKPAARKAGEVTVTNVADVADGSKAGADKAMEDAAKSAAGK